MPDPRPSQPSDSTQLSHTENFVADPGTHLPGLTVLYHPILRRIGERALLAELAAGRPERLSRLEPKFAAPTPEATASPPGHRRLSRTPLLLEPRGDGILLRTTESPTPVAADGQPVAGERLFSATEIERGVVLLLAGRIRRRQPRLNQLPHLPAI